MAFKHIFKVALSWFSTEKVASPKSKVYSKSHHISIEGKSDLAISAAKAFKGDPSLYNPEDLLLSSLVSCHMMSYLYLCDQNNIEVISYTDHAEAILEVNSDASGRFVEVILKPAVVILNPEQIALALDLHKKANQLCFIANSCNFPVMHMPTCLAG